MTPRYSLLTRTVALINLSRFLRLPALKRVTADRSTRIRASAGHQFLHLDLLLAPFMFVPRYCTNVFEYIHLDRFKLYSPESFYRDYASSEKICTMTAKTTPRIRSLRPYEISDPLHIPSYGLRSTQRRLLMLTAGPLGVISAC